MNNTPQQQDHLKGLNEQQLDAVMCDADIVYVDAGPGSGKTHMLTSKLIEYIRTATTQPKIVALSFTNTAARQLGERFYQKLDPSLDGFTFFNGTIHSFCFRMLRAYNRELSRLYDYVILDDEELQELAEDIQRNYSGEVTLKQILACLHSNRKNAPEELVNTVTRLKEAFKVLSIQDILANFAKALDEDGGFRDWIRGQVNVIAIDEAQDLTELYFSIIDRLIAIIPGLKVFLVGDPRQNIFEFNGGSYSNLDEFLSRHKSQVTKHLTITYRCPQCIADYVNTFRFTDCDNNRLMSRNGSDGSLSVERAYSEGHEANIVLSKVLDEKRLSSCAVLSNNLHYLGTLIDRLCDLEIPYKVYGGRKLIKRHIRFLNHILRIIDSDNAYSIIKVAQYAGIDLMENGMRKRSLFYASDLGKLIVSIRDFYRDQPLAILMGQVIEKIMRDPSDKADVSKDYNALLAIAPRYDTVSDYLLAFVTDKEQFAEFFQSDYRECPIDASGDSLTISTIHSAKGMEWDNVFVMGLCEGNFPNDYFCAGMPEQQRREFFNSELKKMYVASTRARNSLTLTYSTSIKRKQYFFQKTPSRFISGLVPPAGETRLYPSRPY